MTTPFVIPTHVHYKSERLAIQTTAINGVGNQTIAAAATGKTNVIIGLIGSTNINSNVAFESPADTLIFTVHAGNQAANLFWPIGSIVIAGASGSELVVDSGANTFTGLVFYIAASN